MSGYAGLSDAQLLQMLQAGQGPDASPTSQPPPPVQVTPLPPLPGAKAGPDYNVVGFDPSKATDAQLQAFASDSDPAMSAPEDFGRSVMGGLQRGVAAIPTMARGMEDMSQGIGQAGVDFLERHGADLGHLKMPAIGDMLHAPGVPGFGDALQAVVGAGARAIHVDPRLAQMGVDLAVPTAALSHYGPSPEQGAVAMNGGVPIHVPQTKAGDYGMRVAEFGPAMTMPGGPIRKLLNALAPGVASQGAQDAAPEGLKTPAALIGALLGGGVAEAGARFGRAPQASFGAAMGDVTDAQMMQAQELRQQAAQSGLQLTLPEAVQQVTGGATGLGRLQRVIEGTKQGQALTAPYFAQRPGQVSAAATALADRIAPATTQPGMVGVRAQDAATGALNGARQVVNRAAAPDYTALTGQTMEPEAYAELAAQPSYRIALEQLRAHPELGAEVAGLPDNSVAVVNEVKKRLGVAADQAAGTPLAPGDNHLAAIRTSTKALADQLARDTSPEYAAANDTVRDLSRQYVEPLRAGPLGAISKTSEVPSQTGALYPSHPLEGAPSETEQAIRVLGNQAPGIAEDLTRQHLMNTLDSSMRSLQGGQNQYAGAKYAVALAGSPEQEATLQAGLAALPEGSARAQEMAGLLEAMRATGKRQQPGSMTAFNESDLKDLHIAPFAQAIGRIGDPLTWGAGIGDVINRANYRRNVASLADMIMAPPEESAAVLQAARRAGRGGVHPLLPALIAQPGARH